MKIFYRIILCFVFCLNITAVIANEMLPHNYAPGSINPYRNDPWFKQIKLNKPEFGKIQPDFYNSYSQPSGITPSKYSNALSRMEREWFHKEFSYYPDEERISNLEEKVFGTIHDGDINFRYKQLRKAFDAKKSIQAKHNRFGRNLFSGVPTSIPVNVDDLFGD